MKLNYKSIAGRYLEKPQSIWEINNVLLHTLPMSQRTQKRNGKYVELNENICGT